MTSSAGVVKLKSLKVYHESRHNNKCHKPLVKLRRTSKVSVYLYFGFPVRLLLLVLLGFIGVAGHAGSLKSPSSSSHPGAPEHLIHSSQEIAFHAEKLLEKSNLSLPKSSHSHHQDENSSLHLSPSPSNTRSFKDARKINKSKSNKNNSEEATLLKVASSSSLPPPPTKSSNQNTPHPHHHKYSTQHQHHSEPLEVSHRLENDFKNSKSVPVVPIQLPPPNETIHYHYTDDDDSQFDFVTTKDYAKLRFPTSYSNFDFFELDNNNDEDDDDNNNNDDSIYNSNDNHHGVKGKTNFDFENNDSTSKSYHENGNNDDGDDSNDNKNKGRSRASISKKSKFKSNKQKGQSQQGDEEHYNKFKDLTDIQLELDSSSSETFPRFYQSDNNDRDHYPQGGKWPDETESDHGMSYYDYGGSGGDGRFQNSQSHHNNGNQHQSSSRDDDYYNFKKNELSTGRRDQGDSKKSKSTTSTNADENNYADYYDGDFNDFKMKSGMMEFESKKIGSNKKGQYENGKKKGSEVESLNKSEHGKSSSSSSTSSDRPHKEQSKSKKKGSSLSASVGSGSRNTSSSSSGSGGRGRSGGGSNSLEEGLSFEYEGPSEDEGGLMRRRPRRSVVHLYDMVVCATGCNPLAYKGYGCYCGFLGSGLTVDGIDRCCAKHDWCYHHAKCPPLLTYFVPYYWTCNDGRPKCVTDYRGWKGICGANLCECDRQFAECLRKFPCPRSRAMCMTSPWRFWQNLLMTPPMRYGYEY